MGRTTPAEKFADSTGGLAGLGDASFKGPAVERRVASGACRARR